MSPSRIGPDLGDLDFDVLSKGENEKRVDENHKKIVEDSALYENENSVYAQSPALKKSLERNTLTIKSKLEKGLFEGRESILEGCLSLTQQQIQKDQSFHEKISRGGSSKRVVEAMSMQQLDVQNDPSQDAQKLDIIKGNSFTDIPSKIDPKEKKKEDEKEQEDLRKQELVEAKSRMKERMSSVRFSTIIANQIQSNTNTKTKKQSKILILDP